MRNSRDFVGSRVKSIIEALHLPHTKQKCQSFPVDADLNLTVIIQYNIVMKRNQRIHVQYTWYSGLEVRPLQSKGNVMRQLKCDIDVSKCKLNSMKTDRSFSFRSVPTAARLFSINVSERLRKYSGVYLDG